MTEHVLRSNEQLKIEVGERGLTVQCQTGCVWLVVDARDIVLVSAQRHRVAGRATAYLQALGDATVRLVSHDAQPQLD